MLSVGVRYGKKLQPDVIRALQPAILAGQILAHFIRKRVSEEGKAADGGTLGEHGINTKWISPELPQPGGEYATARDGRKLYAMDRYHRAMHGDDKYRVRITGNMWESIGVSVANSARVSVTFRRSSLGTDGKRVPNRTKANKVQVFARVPILEPSDPEVKAMLDGLAEHIDRAAIGATVEEASYGARATIRVSVPGGGRANIHTGSTEIPT